MIDESTPEDLPDPRNREILIYVNGELLSRSEAKISVFDSVVQGGDAVWEGLRIYNGRVFQLDAHLRRLADSAKALSFQTVPAQEEIRTALFRTLNANGMRDETHVRLTLTRGRKVTSGMSTRFNRSGCSLIVLAEWKKPVYNTEGIRLITASVRRNSPQTLDSKIHHNNLLNNILAKIEAEFAGVDDAVMLDLHGFVSETNATNIFAVREGRLLTPHADHCLPGITRALTLKLAHDNDIPAEEHNLSVTEVYIADEVFTTGTMGELVPVLEVDGRTIGDGRIGPLTERMQRLFRRATETLGEPIPD